MSGIEVTMHPTSQKSNSTQSGEAGHLIHGLTMHSLFRQDRLLALRMLFHCAEVLDRLPWSSEQPQKPKIIEPQRPTLLRYMAAYIAK